MADAADRRAPGGVPPRGAPGDRSAAGGSIGSAGSAGSAGDRAAETNVGGRLREAIQRWGSIRRFHRELRARSVHGSSYPRIHAYLKGEAEPSRRFLEEAADLLGVRTPWLLDGQGEPTVAEEVVERTVREDRYRPIAEEVEELIGHEFPAYGKLPAAARALIWETYQDHNGHALSVSIFTGQEKLSHAVVARQLGRALMAPLVALRTDPDRLPSRQVGAYVETMCQALKTLVPEPFARGPLTLFPIDDESAGRPGAAVYARASAAR